MRSKRAALVAATIFLVAIAIPSPLDGQDSQSHGPKHHHYKLIVLGTLGGPQSYGDPGHGAANITGRGTAAGDADTAIADPYYPNFNPFLSGGSIGSYPYVYHAFTTDGSELIDLGGLPGANSSTPSHITDNGLVAGQSLNGSIDPITGWPQLSAVLWTGGQIINLGTLGGYESVSARVNGHGQVAGSTTNNVPDPYSFVYFVLGGGFSNGTQNRAFVWDERNGMQDLGTLGGPDASAMAMNERGQIAGLSYTNDIPNATTGIPTVDPFLWREGRMIDLGSLGGTFGLAGDMNNGGQVIGNSNLAGDVTQHGFIWDRNTLTDIGTLGGTWSDANALNERGHVVGQATIATGDYHAYIWEHGVLKDLGPLPGFADTTCIGAFGINSRDQVVGQAVQNFCAGPGADAFLWEEGDMIDVNDLVTPGSNLTLNDIEQINDRGEMFGSGTLTSGEDRAFLLIPCDDDHPNVAGCDYSLVDASGLASRPSPSVSGAAGRTLPQSLMRRMNRYRFPGLAVRPRN